MKKINWVSVFCFFAMGGIFLFLIILFVGSALAGGLQPGEQTSTDTVAILGYAACLMLAAGLMLIQLITDTAGKVKFGIIVVPMTMLGAISSAMASLTLLYQKFGFDMIKLLKQIPYVPYLENAVIDNDQLFQYAITTVIVGLVAATLGTYLQATRRVGSANEILNIDGTPIFPGDRFTVWPFVNYHHDKIERKIKLPGICAGLKCKDKRVPVKIDTECTIDIEEAREFADEHPMSMPDRKDFLSYVTSWLTEQYINFAKEYTFGEVLETHPVEASENILGLPVYWPGKGKISVYQT